jgi:nitrogen-specific signal transduction histidine kinase
VVDDAQGVAPAVRATLFEPGVSTKKGGWGVGLSLARRIVEDVHGGRLRLEPADRGARFVMSLPAAPEPEPSAEPRVRLPWARGLSERGEARARRGGAGDGSL